MDFGGKRGWVGKINNLPWCFNVPTSSCQIRQPKKGERLGITSIGCRHCHLQLSWPHLPDAPRYLLPCRRAPTKLAKLGIAQPKYLPEHRQLFTLPLETRVHDVTTSSPIRFLPMLRRRCAGSRSKPHGRDG